MDNSDLEKVLIALDYLAEFEYFEIDTEGEDILLFLYFSRWI